MTNQGGEPKPRRKEAERNQRLAEALRANLRRRKAQARHRASGHEEERSEPGVARPRQD